MRIHLDDINYDGIINRNEKKVKAMLCTFFEDPTNYHLVKTLSEKDILDIYALILNQLPAHYVHKTTIVVNEHTRGEHINAIIDGIIDRVKNNPKQ